MKNKKSIIYILITFFLSVLIFVLPLSNNLIYTVILLSFSLYLSIYYFKNIKYPYLRQIYILWGLVIIIYNFVNFSLFSLLLTILLVILITLQYLILRNIAKKKIEINSIKEEETKKDLNSQIIINNDIEFEEKVKKLYIELQTSFMNFQYARLREILSDSLYKQYEKQLKNLEKNNRVAVRNNIVFFDFKIISDDQEKVKINIGIYEDKYTKIQGEESKSKNISYESYYELIILKQEMVIEAINLIYSHSKKKKS